MDWRTFRDADLPAVAALLADGLIYDRPSVDYVGYLLREDPSFDPRHIWVADSAGEIVGVTVGTLADDVRQSPAGIKLFVVAPAYRRQGIATRLLDLTEESFRAQGVTACVAVNCGNHRLSLGLDVRYTSALCMLLGRGYEQIGTTQDMKVDLVGPTAPDLTTEADEDRLREHGVIVRRARPDERRWVCDGVERAMVAPTPGRRWSYLAEQSFRRDPPTIEVAENVHTGALLGFAAYDAARWGALGPMGVLPGSQRAGLGSVLLRRCLRDMKADGYESGEIFSVGPIPFYAKTINAHISRVFYRYAKQL